MSNTIWPCLCEIDVLPVGPWTSSGEVVANSGSRIVMQCKDSFVKLHVLGVRDMDEETDNCSGGK